MNEVILFALWVSTFIFFIYREIKIKKDKENHEWWLSELKDCIHGIENEFSRQCYEITEKALSQHNYSSYGEHISKLEKEYQSELYNKVIERMGKHRVTTLPGHVVKEYERNISEIADIYRNIFTIIT